MRIIGKIRSRLSALFSRGKFNSDMEAEMQLHLELRIEKNIAAGMEPEEARYAALRECGGADRIREQCRDGRRWKVMTHIFRDIRFGARALRKSPGFSL